MSTSRIAPALRVVVLCLAAWLSQAHAQEAGEAIAAREVAVGADRFVKGSKLPGWVDALASLPASKLEGPAVQLLLDTQLLADSEPALHVHKAIVANTPPSLDAVGRFQIPFNPAYQNVELHSLRIRRGADSLDRLAGSKVSFLQREVGLDNAVYTGDVTASVIIPDLRVGDVLEYEYTIHGANPVLGGKFAHEVSWDQFWTTELRRVTLLVPAGHEVKWRFEGGNAKLDSTPDESRAGAFRRLRWQAAKLPRTDVDPGTPANYHPTRLRFSEFQDWRDVAGWANQLFASASGETPELAQLIAKLKEKPTADERVSAALAWVQTEIRYVSLSLGESSHRPAPAALTLERRFGDCKDKSALLVQLLRGMGFKADAVLISAREVRGKSKQLPSPHVFDHAIVRAEVDGKTYFLDPTRLGQGGNLATQGQPWDGAEVLVVNDATTELAQVTTEKTALTYDMLEERLHIATFGGPGELSIRRIWTGVRAEIMRVAFAQASNDRVQKALLEPYERRIPGFQLTKGIRLEDDKQNNRLTAVIQMRVPAPAVSSADRWTVNYEASNLEGVFQLPGSSARTQPLAMPFRTGFSYKLEIEFPQSVRVNTDPTQQDFRAPGMRLARASTFRGNKATMRLDAIVTDPEVEPKQMASYASAVRWLRSAERSDFWVAKAASTGDSVRARYESRVATGLERISKALESGRLTGDDLANAYCERARSFMFQDKLDNALADIERAVKISPESPAIQVCRGNVLAHADGLKEAIDAYSSAIALDSRNGEAYYARGVARFNDGQLALAAADFVQAGRTGVRNKNFAQLWHAFALRRMGKEPDAAVKASAAAKPRGDWPIPAISMMYDLLSPEDVLALVNAKSGDDRELTLTEAYYAIAQWHYARGNKAEAIEYFRKTLGQGAILYVEHESARLQLKALEATK